MLREADMHTRRPFLPLLMFLPSLILAACSLEIATPGPTTGGLPEGLEAKLVVEPAEVAQHAPFTVRITVTNTSADTIRIVTGHGCLALPNLTQRGSRIPFKGTDLGCTAAITTHSFAPGEVVTLNWAMRAELYAEHHGDRDDAPAPRGAYIVVAEFGGMPGDGVGDRPKLSAPLWVR
jgi:hypothetical protein